MKSIPAVMFVSGLCMAGSDGNHMPWINIAGFIIFAVSSPMMARMEGVGMKINVICGVCGLECSAKLNHIGEMVVTCHNCQNTLKGDEKLIGDLEDEIFELTREGEA